MMTKHFLDLDQFSSTELQNIIKLAKNLKAKQKNGEVFEPFAGKTLAMIFEKLSTRTRVSFEVAMNQLGGNALVLSKEQSQLSHGETIKDTAGVLSRYVDAITFRGHAHQDLLDLAQNSSVPVINALTDFSHPCQIMASVLAIEEALGTVEGKILTWFGDVNNVLNSYIHGATKFGYKLRISVPKSLYSCNDLVEIAKKEGGDVEFIEDPKQAAQDSDVLITDTWVSMGDASDKDNEVRQKKIELLSDYQINDELMSCAKKSAIFTHCLPAIRNQEVTDSVIDGEQSIVLEEAENRLHAQKAVLLYLFGIGV